MAAGCGKDSDPGALGPPPGDRPAPESRAKTDRPVAPVEPKAAKPVKIEIPTIGVAAPVIPLGLKRDGTLDVPRDYDDTGWSVGGPEPGEKGGAVIAGHVDSKAGPAVFYKLDELDRGDEIRVERADGSTATFAVTGTERHPKAAFPTEKVYTRSERALLRLVTCSGNFDEASRSYVDNTIVYAERTG